MDKIAIYDMDRTVTRIGTFTPFLIFAALRRPHRLVFFPIYLLSLLGYPLGLINRTQIKQLGFRLIIGRRIAEDKLTALSRDFAAHVGQTNLLPGARPRLEADRAEGCRLIMATASPDYYAQHIGALLGFDEVIATRQHRFPDGSYGYKVDGRNCYGLDKLHRVKEWLGEDARANSHIRFYSDHHSDAYVMEWADQPIAANPNPKLYDMARAKGWEVVRFA